MPDLRYHLFYFIAIFLMLGVGMLVGGSFYGPAQVRQQQKGLAALRVQVDGAVQDGRQAKAELASTENALDATRQTLVRGKLTGRRVVLVQTGDYPAATQDAAAAVQDAGASVTATVVLTNKWQAQDEGARKSALSQLTAVLTQSGDTPLQALEDAGLVTVSGMLAGSPPSGIVLVGGGAADSAGPTVDAGLIAAMKASAPDVVAVGVEPFGAAVSFMGTYQAAGISTIDCVDRPLGKLALPYVLRGGPDAGDYGLKGTARLSVPPSLASHE